METHSTTPHRRFSFLLIYLYYCNYKNIIQHDFRRFRRILSTFYNIRHDTQTHDFFRHPQPYRSKYTTGHIFYISGHGIFYRRGIFYISGRWNWWNKGTVWELKSWRKLNRGTKMKFEISVLLLYQWAREGYPPGWIFWRIFQFSNNM